jgi:hypothetical protein
MLRSVRTAWACAEPKAALAAKLAMVIAAMRAVFMSGSMWMRVGVRRRWQMLGSAASVVPPFLESHPESTIRACRAWHP